MKTCDKCGITVRTQHTRCPLCQGALHGRYDKNDALFPTAPQRPSQAKLILQWASFGAVAVSVICLAVNVMVTPHIWWAIWAAGGAFCSWLSIFIGIQKRHNLLKNALWQMVLVVAAALAGDWYTGWHSWSVDYFLPLGIVLTLALMILTCILQRLTPQEYLIYLLLVCVCGLVPVVLLLTGVLVQGIPSVICGVICLLLLAALLIFQHSAVTSEVKKTFHF